MFEHSAVKGVSKFDVAVVRRPIQQIPIAYLLCDKHYIRNYRYKEENA